MYWYFLQEERKKQFYPRRVEQMFLEKIPVNFSPHMNALMFF